MAAPDLWRTAVHGLVPALAEVQDSELLRRFYTSRDEAAFELLVYRHGPLVWAACRRMLRDHHAAEDAFQATFLALARQSGSIREGRSVPAWLHRVAVRASIHLRRRNRRALLPLDDDVIDPRRDPADTADDRETVTHIDAAINALSDRLRQVFILCELHGYSLADAAARLGVPIGTVASRLGRARARLRKVLLARGLAVGSMAGLAAAEIVPPAVRGASVRMAAGGTKVTPMVMALARRAAGPPVRTPVFGLACSMAAGFALVAFAFGGPESPPVTPKPQTKEPPPAVAERTDAVGVPLPEGAVVRLGSNRFRIGGGLWGAVVFSPDGKQLAVGDTTAVSLFETATGRRVRRVVLPDKHHPQVIRFLADGKRLGIGSGDWNHAATWTVHDLATGKEVATAKFTGKGQVFVIDSTAGGARVMVSDNFDRLFLWDVAAAREVWEADRKEATFALPFTADGKHFVVSGYRVTEWRDAATGKVVSRYPDPGLQFRDRYSPGVAPDGRIAVGSDKGDTVAVLAAEGENRVRLLKADHRTERFFFSPDARYLAGPAEVGTQVWDLTRPDDAGPVAQLPTAAGAGFSPDGKTLALADDGALTLWSTADWKRQSHSADPPSPVLRVRFLPDGKRVLGLTRAGWVVWPVAGGPATRLSDDSPVNPDGYSDVSADARVAVDVLRAPTPGADVKGIGGKYELRITDLASGKDRRIALDRQPWAPVQITPNGRLVSAYMQTGEIVVFDSATGATVHQVKRPDRNSTVFGATAAADGKGLAWSVVGVFREDNRGHPDAGPMYSEVTVTDHRTGQSWKMDPMPWSVYSGGARFSEDGSRVIVQGRWGQDWNMDSVTVWDTGTGRRFMKWDRRSGRTESTSLSADHRSLLAGTMDGELALVEVATGGERAKFQHEGYVASAAFSGDGTRAVSSSPDGPVYVWDLLRDPGRWDPTKADAVWADLASSDAKTAYAAIRTLRTNSAEAVAFLKDRVKLPAVPADDTIATWLKALDAPAFADREKAQRELTAVAGLIRPKLDAARKTASAEAGRRLDQVLKTLDEQVTPDGLRQIRACEVLECIRSPEAIRVLKTWAGGPAGYRLTIEATESLERVSK
jgi:RNA polymerase sigma factor (sigma-70 family)